MAKRNPEGLTDQQKRFVQEYLIDLNATAAAKRACYKQPNKQGPRLLVNVGIAAAISAAQAARSQRTKITADRVLQELARIGFADARKVFEWGPDGVTLLDSDLIGDDAAATVAEVSETTTETGGTIRCKLHPKLPALIKLGEHLGLFNRPPQDGDHDPDSTTEEVSDLVAALRGHLDRRGAKNGGPASKRS